MSSDDELLGSVDDLEAAGVTSEPQAKGRGLIEDEAGVSGEDQDEDEAPERPGEFDSFIDNRPLPPDKIQHKRGEKRARDEGLSDEFSEGDEDLNELGEDDRILIGAKPKATGSKHRRLKKKGRTQENDIGAEGTQGEKNAAERIAETLFGGEDDISVDLQDDDEEGAERNRRDTIDLSEDFSDEEEINDFIVDEFDKPVRRPPKRKKGAQKGDITDEQLEAVRQIFGTDRLDDLEYQEDEMEMEDLDELNPEEQKGLLMDKIREVYEPSQLDAAFMSKHDEKIKATDIPERFQLRFAKRPVVDTDDIEREVDFIGKQAFPHLLGEDRFHGGAAALYTAIGTVLSYIHTLHYEIPYILQYSKEAWMDASAPTNKSLNKKDIWTIYTLDQVWTQLVIKKEAILKSMDALAEAEEEEDNEEDDENADDIINFDANDEMERKARRAEERKKKLDEKRRANALRQIDINDMKAAIVDCTDTFQLDDHVAQFKSMFGEEASQKKKYKRAGGRDFLKVATEAGIPDFAHTYAPNVTNMAKALLLSSALDNLNQPISPLEAAGAYLSEQFSSVDAVIDASVKYLTLMYAANPSIRSNIESTLSLYACVTTHPTKVGKGTIDAFHEYASIKALRMKPVDQFDHPEFSDQYARILKAEKEGLITHKIEFAESLRSNLDQRFDFFISRAYNDWDQLRRRVLDGLIEDHLKPLAIQRVQERLKKKAFEAIVHRASMNLERILLAGPYPRAVEEEGNIIYPIIMGISYADPNRDRRPTQAVVLDQNGNPIASLSLVLIGQKRATDLDELRDFIEKHEPTVIALGADSLEAVSNLYQDICEITTVLKRRNGKDHHVTLMDPEVATIFAASKYGKKEFPEYDPGELRAVSLARRLYDPLSEICRLVNIDHDLRHLKLDPLQSIVPGNILDERLEQVFVNVINNVGVDINRLYRIPWLQTQLNFVAGFGPRKAHALWEAMEKTSGMLTKRQELLDAKLVGPTVFKNAAGFIKFNRFDIKQLDGDYNLLDTMRIHPDDYEYAIKMAKDAVDDDDRNKRKRRNDDDELDEQEALEELLANPKKLEEIDISQFDQLLRDEFQMNKFLTLTDIKNELNNPFVDFRNYFDLPIESVFDCATNTTTETLRPLMLVQVRVLQSKHPDRLNLRLIEIDIPAFIERGCEPAMWQTDSDGHRPFIPPGTTLTAMIVSVDRIKMSVRVSCNETDISDAPRRFLDEYLPHDSYLDTYEVLKAVDDDDIADDQLDEDRRRRKEEEEKPRYGRSVVNPSFKNLTGRQARKLLDTMEIGQYIFRPASQDNKHIVAEVKFYDGLIFEVEVEELDKPNDLALGRKLKLGNTEYDDLNELGLRGIESMTSLAHEVFSHEKFVKGDREEVTRVVKDLKRQTPEAIIYRIGLDHKNPGTFVFVHVVRKEVAREPVGLTPDGLRYRSKNFTSPKQLFEWFKRHAKEPVPQQHPKQYPTAPQQFQQRSYTAAGGADMDYEPTYDQGYGAMNAAASYPAAPLGAWPQAPPVSSYNPMEMPGQPMYGGVSNPLPPPVAPYADSWSNPHGNYGSRYDASRYDDRGHGRDDRDTYRPRDDNRRGYRQDDRDDRRRDYGRDSRHRYDDRDRYRR